MRDPIEQLHRIQKAISKITEYAKKGRRKFDTEEEIQLSVIYYLQTISEAANTIPQNFKDHHSEIPWKQLVDYQNLITDYYLEIDRDALWTIVDRDLVDLRACFERGNSSMTDALERIQHIQTAIAKISKYTKRGRRRFDREEETQNSSYFRG